ncbi:MAG: monofunctional biosynthetic peptidoglycan transglycosylase [Tannerellaceae bacterium]
MKNFLLYALQICKKLMLLFFFSSVLFVLAYRFIPVYYTPLMFIRLFEQWQQNKELVLDHHWVSMDQISHYLPMAVVASEDNLFLRHHGFDFNQIEKAREAADKGKKLRGASTISQQTAKNVFLWPGRSYIRKGFEAYFTFLIELVWSKERIMEVYLNSIEMGNGIYGAEAVAQSHFKTTARKLSAPQCALVAASLPNPIKMNSGKPSAYMLKRQSQILDLMTKIEPINMGYGTKTTTANNTSQIQLWKNCQLFLASILDE